MKQITYIVSIIFSLPVIALSGCATQGETMKSQGYPAPYAEGFEDGCHSGNKAGGSYFDQFKKDVRRFNSDSDYAQKAGLMLSGSVKPTKKPWTGVHAWPSNISAWTMKGRTAWCTMS